MKQIDNLDIVGRGIIFQSKFTELHELSGDTAMLKEFLDFLKQYGVIGLAIAVIIGGKLNALISATVDGILMPIITCFIPGGTWRTATLDLGPFHFLLGPFLGAAIDFLIVAWVVFYFAKKVLKEDKVVKK